MNQTGNKYENWEVELRKELGESVPMPNSSVASINQTGLAFIAIVLFLFTCFAAYYKDPTLHGLIARVEAAETAMINPVSPSANVSEAILVELKGIRKEIDGLKQIQDNNKKLVDVKIDKMSKQVNINADRIGLLGAVINDNSIATTKGDSDQLYLNSDWSLPRLPKYLNMTPEDKEFLNKYIKCPE